MNKVNSKKVSPEAKKIAKGWRSQVQHSDQLAEEIEDYARRREIRGLYRRLLKADRELDQIINYIRKHPEYSGCKMLNYYEDGVEIQSRASYIIGFIEDITASKK